MTYWYQNSFTAHCYCHTIHLDNNVLNTIPCLQPPNWLRVSSYVCTALTLAKSFLTVFQYRMVTQMQCWAWVQQLCVLVLCWHFYPARSFGVSLVSPETDKLHTLKYTFFRDVFWGIRLLGHSSWLHPITSWPGAVPWAVLAAQLVSACRLALSSCHTIPSTSFEALTSSPEWKLQHNVCLESVDFLSGETQHIIFLSISASVKFGTRWKT